MANSMTTLLYVIVLAGWFLLMCVVLRCCSDSESQSIFDLEEINLAAGFNHKPTAIVDGQPVRFARVQPLGDSPPPAAPDVATRTEPGGGGGSTSTSRSHRQQDMVLERLEIPTATSALPSAQAVWSPILALRTFVEPLTSRASAAFRNFNFHISFHDPEEEGAGGVGVATTSALPTEAAAAPPSPPSAPQGEAAAAATAPPPPPPADEEQGAGARNGGGRRQKEWSSPTAARAEAAAATAASEEIRVASAEHFWPPGAGGIELSVVSSGHDRAEGGVGGDGERKRVDTAEMVEQDERDEYRVAV